MATDAVPLGPSSAVFCLKVCWRCTTPSGGTASRAGGGRPPCGVSQRQAASADAGSRVTCPINRYPRRCAVAMKRGVLGSSPSACRSSRMQTISTPSLTTVSGQTASSRVVLDTNCCACAIRQRSTAKVLGRRAMVWAPYRRHSLARSRQIGEARGNDTGCTGAPLKTN